MTLHFTKYQATGNDFVILDNRNGAIKLSIDDVQRICDRRFGVGADGVMLLEKHPSLDFNLVYYNSDGSQSLCGNGTRAAMKMASSLGIVNGKASFNAFDGAHQAEIVDHGIVKVRMNDVTVPANSDFINTGSPHLIRFVTGLATRLNQEAPTSTSLSCLAITIFMCAHTSVGLKTKRYRVVRVLRPLPSQYTSRVMTLR